jgi:serine/threonine protein kinase
LELIATLKDPHLVQIQKTYQLGDKFNILFPWAKTNLFDYLRNSVWRAPQQARIGKNPLWEQILGITKALSKIINFTDPDEPDKTIFGYHCDLKPQNILIDNSAAGSRDVFKITDFGQATFLNPVVAGTSQIRSYIQVHGGTDAYAPPEYLDAEQDRVYDIWSLAIIVLEVLAYAVRGADGLLHPENGLDNVRATREGRQTNARFYTDGGSGAIVKPKIRKWIEDLLKDPSIEDIENQQFVQNLCQLIALMLEPQMKKRIGIDAVVAKMGEIFQMKASEIVEVPAESLKAKDEVVLVDLKYVKRLYIEVNFLLIFVQNRRLLPTARSRAPVKSSSIRYP